MTFAEPTPPAAAWISAHPAVLRRITVAGECRRDSARLRARGPRHRAVAVEEPGSSTSLITSALHAFSNEVNVVLVLEGGLDVVNMTICHLDPLIYYIFMANMMLS